MFLPRQARACAQPEQERLQVYVLQPQMTLRETALPVQEASFREPLCLPYRVASVVRQPEPEARLDLMKISRAVTEEGSFARP